MLGNKDAGATLAVKDLARARPFYEGLLGLTPTHESEPGVVVYKAGVAQIMVYESAFAGTNKATAITWGVGTSIDEIVRALAAKGVAFEHYDMPDTTRDGDIHVSGEMRVAWFKDPDGNIICLVNA